MTQASAAVVLDTSVVSVLFNRAPDDSLYLFYRSSIEGRRRVISFQTLEEAWFGAFKADWGERRRNELSRHLDNYTIIWPDDTLTAETARLRATEERKGRPLGHSDAWIAATALWLGCPLASHDRDFSGIDGLTLIQAPG